MDIRTRLRHHVFGENVHDEVNHVMVWDQGGESKYRFLVVMNYKDYYLMTDHPYYYNGHILQIDNQYPYSGHNLSFETEVTYHSLPVSIKKAIQSLK